MSRLTCFTNDLAGIGESSALRRVYIEIHQASLDAEYHRDEMLSAEEGMEEGYSGLYEAKEFHKKWFRILNKRIAKLEARADKIRKGLWVAYEAEPPVRTGRLTREWLRYERGCGSKPDQTRSRAARLRSIERRGVRR